jgi:transmembrane sensor
LVKMKYNYSDINDFLHDDSFVRWVLFNENDVYWQRFMASDPAYPGLMDRAKKLILAVQEAEKGDELASSQGEVWRRITEGIRTTPVPGRSRPAFYRNFLRVDRAASRWAASRWAASRWAAGILLTLAIGWVAVTTFDSKPQAGETSFLQESPGKEVMSEVVNREIIPMTVSLDDGSTVVLQKDSKLSFSKPFGMSGRKVFLSGEAFFDVARDSLRPFTVYSGEIVTEVLGTSFSVRAFEKDNEVEVNVKTGKVSVFRQDAVTEARPRESAIVLVPNQKVVFSRKDEHFDKRLVEKPLPIRELSEYPRQRFEDISVPDLLKLLEDRYGVQFVYDRALLERCVITTTLNDEPMFDNLEVICRTIGASYREEDARIVIESDGCNIR